MRLLPFVSRLSGALLLTAGLVTSTSCYPGEVTSITDFDTVVTVRNGDYDFQQNRTYAMPDFVLHLCDIEELQLPDCIELSRDFDDTILDRIAMNMAAFGYTRITDNSEPDIVVLPTVLGSENFAAFVSYPWWGGWGGWPGWGWCPGCWGPGSGIGFPPSIGVVRYDTGTIFIDIVDPRAQPPDIEEPDQIIVEWDATINGLLGTTEAGTESRINDNIDQAFTQSPYLDLRAVAAQGREGGAR